MRGPPFNRLTRRPDAAKGDAAKNSARLPVRLVLRSHSSGETITAARWPLRVMVCGPQRRALSLTSLKCALACATDQTGVLKLISKQITMV